MDSTRKIKMSEFKQNNGENGNRLWVLIENKVYEVTDFSHPGGNEILMDEHGTDRFDEFESIHSPAAKKQMIKFLIGEIDLAKDTAVEDKKDTKQSFTDKKTDEVKVGESSSSSGFLVVVPIMVIVVFAIYKFVLSKN